MSVTEELTITNGSSIQLIGTVTESVNGIYGFVTEAVNGIYGLRFQGVNDSSQQINIKLESEF